MNVNSTCLSARIHSFSARIVDRLHFDCVSTGKLSRAMNSTAACDHYPAAMFAYRGWIGDGALFDTIPGHALNSLRNAA